MMSGCFSAINPVASADCVLLCNNDGNVLYIAECGVLLGAIDGVLDGEACSPSLAFSSVIDMVLSRIFFTWFTAEIGFLWSRVLWTSWQTFYCIITFMLSFIFFRTSRSTRWLAFSFIITFMSSIILLTLWIACESFPRLCNILAHDQQQQHDYYLLYQWLVHFPYFSKPFTA